MMSFRNSRLSNLRIPGETQAALDDILKASLRTAPRIANPTPFMDDYLTGRTSIDSIEFSNLMEGVRAREERIEPLAVGFATPENQIEQRLWNYRQAWDWLHKSHEDIQVEPAVLRRLHSTVGYRIPPDVTQWKSPQAEADTAELCRLFRYALDTERILPVPAAAALTLDFHNLRPFTDDPPHSAATRLLLLLALYKGGIRVQRYVSLEKLMEASKADYAHALKRSSEGWREGRHDLAPWLRYAASIVQAAYKEFERQLAVGKPPHPPRRRGAPPPKPAPAEPPAKAPPPARRSDGKRHRYGDVDFERLRAACRRRGTFTAADIAGDLGLDEEFVLGHIGPLVRQGLVAKVKKGLWRWVGD